MNKKIWSGQIPTTDLLDKFTGTSMQYNISFSSFVKPDFPKPEEFKETPIGDLFVTWDNNKNIPPALLNRVPDSVYGEFNPQGWDILDHEQLLLSLLEIHKKSLLGIAANQLLALLPTPHRVCVILDNDDNSISLVNPHIIKYDRELAIINSIEGCASLPGIQVELKRYPKIVVIHEKVDGVVETTFEGRAAIIAQHEIDHLDGVLILHRETKQNWKYRETHTNNNEA